MTRKHISLEDIEQAAGVSRSILEQAYGTGTCGRVLERERHWPMLRLAQDFNCVGFAIGQLPAAAANALANKYIEEQGKFINTHDRQNMVTIAMSDAGLSQLDIASIRHTLKGCERKDLAEFIGQGMHPTSL